MSKNALSSIVALSIMLVSYSPAFCQTYETSGTRTQSSKNSENRLEDQAEHARKQGQYDQAIVICNQILQLDPRNDWAWGERAYARYGKGDLIGALADVDHALALNGNHGNNYGIRGLIEIAQKQYAAAILDGTKCIELSPTIAMGFVVRGQAEYFQGQYQESVADCHQAEALEPTCASSFFYDGLSNQYMGNYRPAIIAFKKYIQMVPRSGDAYFNLAECEESSGNKGEAIADMQTAARLYQEQNDSADYQDAVAQLQLFQQTA